MPREKELMHDHLTRLREQFGDVEMISLHQAAKLLHKDQRSLLNDKSFPTKKIGKRTYVPLINLARWLA